MVESRLSQFGREDGHLSSSVQKSELSRWTGVQVRSFSQLKYDLRDVNTFVLEPDDDNPLARRRTHSFDGVQSLEEQQTGVEEPASDAARSARSAKVVSRSEPSPEGGSPNEASLLSALGRGRGVPRVRAPSTAKFQCFVGPFISNSNLFP